MGFALPKIPTLTVPQDLNLIAGDAFFELCYKAAAKHVIKTQLLRYNGFALCCFMLMMLNILPVSDCRCNRSVEWFSAQSSASTAKYRFALFDKISAKFKSVARLSVTQSDAINKSMHETGLRTFIGSGSLRVSLSRKCDLELYSAYPGLSRTNVRIHTNNNPEQPNVDKEWLPRPNYVHFS